jgi:hypothetical protein
VFVVELDLLHLETPAPLRFIPQTILERAARVLLDDEKLYRFRVVKLGERVQAHRVDRIRLPVAKQAFQGLDTGVSFCRAEARQALRDEGDLLGVHWSGMNCAVPNLPTSCHSAAMTASNSSWPGWSAVTL